MKALIFMTENLYDFERETIILVHDYQWEIQTKVLTMYFELYVCILKKE